MNIKYNYDLGQAQARDNCRLLEDDMAGGLPGYCDGHRAEGGRQGEVCTVLAKGCVRMDAK
jgi:hypothetical protein